MSNDNINFKIGAICMNDKFIYYKGQGLVEYALILVLVAIVVIVILALLGGEIGNIFSNLVSNL